MLRWLKTDQLQLTKLATVPRPARLQIRAAGYFNPLAKGEPGLIVLGKGKTHTIRDVCLFTGRVGDNAEDYGSQYASRIIPGHLQGLASYWYTNELSEEQRLALRHDVSPMVSVTKTT